MLVMMMMMMMMMWMLVMMMVKMVSVWLTAAALLCHQYNAVADTVTEQLFFNDDAPPGGSRRTVHVGDDVVLECEAAGRPSPTVYWQHKGLHLNPVYTRLAVPSSHGTLRRTSEFSWRYSNIWISTNETKPNPILTLTLIRLATMDMGQKVGAAVPRSMRELHGSPSNTMLPGPRPVPSYQVVS